MLISFLSDSFPSSSAKELCLADLTAKILRCKLHLASARLENDQDLIWEYGDHLEYLGDFYAQALAAGVE